MPEKISTTDLKSILTQLRTFVCESAGEQDAGMTAVVAAVVLSVGIPHVLNDAIDAVQGYKKGVDAANDDTASDAGEADGKPTS